MDGPLGKCSVKDIDATMQLWKNPFKFKCNSKCMHALILTANIFESGPRSTPSKLFGQVSTDYHVIHCEKKNLIPNIHNNI